jgi:hypothetical protein
MKEIDRKIRLFVYEHCVRCGAPPSADEIASANAYTIEDVEAALTRLETEYHALALAPATKNIWMAHPFSGVPTPFSVETDDVTYWANCAWDAVTIPSMLSCDARVPARCAGSGAAIDLTFRNGAVVDAPDGGVVHFVVPPREFWHNVGYT